MKPAFAPLTERSYAFVTGRAPERTMRGFTVEDRGAPLFVAGIYPDEDRYVLFSHATSAFREQLDSFAARRAVAMGARKVREMLAGIRGPVDASASAKHQKTAEFLERLGFRRLEGTTYRFAGLTMREKVELAERVMKARGTPVEIPVRHYFSDGVYAREIRIPAGTLLTGKIHKRTNLNLLSAGEISVLTERGVERVRAPFTVVSPAGTKRIAYAHTDCVWTTVHGTHETDLEKIEAEFIAQSEAEFLAYTRALQHKGGA